MADLILPGNSNLALALREPNMLVPGRRPIGALSISPRFSKGLRIASIFGQKLGTGFINYATSGRLEFTNSEFLIPAVVPNFGFGYVQNTSSTPAQATLPTLSGNTWSAHLVGYKRGTSRFGFFGNSTSNMVWMDDVSGGFRLNMRPNTGALGATLYPNAEGFYVLTCSVSSGIGNAWLNGVKELSSITNATAASGVTLNYIITSSFWSQSGSGELILFNFWDRALSDPEMMILQRDHYAVWEPANSSPYLISLPSAALPTLSSPTAINITSGGFQPRVTATY